MTVKTTPRAFTLNDAEKLIPNGYFWLVRTGDPESPLDKRPYAVVYSPTADLEDDSKGGVYRAYANTPAEALAAAAIEAKRQMQ